MLALYRSGRQTEALEVYREARRRPRRGRPGIEPGPELQRLHEAVLDQDPSLELRRRSRDLPRELDAGRGAAAGRARRRARRGCASTGRRRGSARAGSSRSAAPRGSGRRRLAAELAGEVQRAGGVVRYLAGRGPPAAVLAALGELRGGDAPDAASSSTTPTAPAAEVVGRARRRWRWPGRRCSCCVTRTRDALAGVARRRRAALGPLDADGGARGRRAPRRARRVAAGGQRRRAAPGARDGRAGWARARGGAPRRVRRPGGRRPAAPSCARWRPSWPAASSSCRRRRSAPSRGDEDGAPVRCPFKGLASFDVADAPYFFGRERLVAELVARLVGAPLLGVVGPSGSGKSSVVRAGLLPALGGGVLPGSASWAQVVMRPGEHPLRELADATAGLGRGAACCWRSISSRRRSRPAATSRSAAAFVAELVAARTPRPHRRARDPGRLLRALRRLPGALGLLAAHHVLVGAMRRDELRRAVERPAARAGPAASSPSSPTRWWPTSSTSPARCRCCPPRCSSCGSAATGGGCACPPTRPPAACAARWRGTPRTPSPGSTPRSRPSRAACCCGWRPRAPAARSSAGASPLAELGRRRGRRERRRAAHRPAPADGQRRRGRARARGAAARVAAAARLAGGGRRGPPPAPPPRRRRARVGRRAGATPASSTAARAWPPRWSGAPATSPTSTAPSAPSWTPARAPSGTPRGARAAPARRRARGRACSW